MSLEQLKNLLSTEIVPHLNDHKTKHAAVMVVIYGQDPKIILTEKPKTLSMHGGEISFPGGKLSKSDSDLLDTAIRETREEISLEISRSNVVGQLKPVQTRNSGFTIVPFVTILEKIRSMYPNDEVQQILDIPIIPLLRELRIDDDIDHRAFFETYMTTFEDKVIWGATARILKQIADIFKQHNLL